MPTTYRERYVEFLTRSGLRGTEQAALVVDAVCSMPGTFSTEDAVAQVAGRASRPTIYRTLLRLVEAGLLLPVTFNRQEVYVVVSTD